MKTFKERLQWAVNARLPGVPVTELCALFGCSRASYYRFLDGAFPDVAVLAEMSRRLGVSMDWLVFGQRLPTPTASELEQTKVVAKQRSAVQKEARELTRAERRQRRVDKEKRKRDREARRARRAELARLKAERIARHPLLR